jgi:hypothetical protein
VKIKKSMLHILILLVTLLTACSSEQTTTEEEKVPATTAAESPTSDTKTAIYTDTETGLAVYETEGWVFEKESKTGKGVNVTFSNEKVKGILSILSTDKSFDEIKNELKVGAGQIEIIDESDEYLSFKSLRKESIRTDIYLNRLPEGNVYIFSFLTPAEQFLDNQGKIEAILNHVQAK